MARQFTWTAPDGTSIVLTDRAAGYRVMAQGTRGLSSPEYRIARSTYAGLPGTSLDSIQPGERQISLGLQVEADTTAERRARSKALVRAFRPMAGDGLLSVATETGEVRTLACRYAGGLEGDGETEFAGNVARAVVTLLAFDPWFYGDALTVSVGLDAPTVFFPIFPLVLSASTVQGEFTVDLSDTDDAAPPVWTITGPGTSLVLTNQTTGKVITVNATIASGEIMVIDTRPGHQSVRRGNGTNLMASVASDPALWQLTDGVNQISAALTGATSDSRITGAYRPRYAGI